MKLICRSCAKKKGGTMPESYSAGMYTEICHVCKTFSYALINIDDYDFPNKKSTTRKDHPF